MATPTKKYIFAPENDEFCSIEYKTLDKDWEEIRLLKIDGLAPNSHQLIDKVSLKNSPRYWALSYYSGSSSKAIRQVQVNNRPFNAFINLAVAIDLVRIAWRNRQAQQNSPRRAEPLVLWTDQICN
jgi:hypothetical protein